MDLHHHFQLHPVISLPLRPAPTHNEQVTAEKLPVHIILGAADI